MVLAIVIPTYNEKNNIEALVKRALDLNLPGAFFIIVDDNSQDGTADVVMSMSKSISITLIQRPCKLGLGSACIAGFKYALSKKADYIIEMDADLSHDPSDIPKLVIAAQSGADLVIGSRKIPGGEITGWSFARRFMSGGAALISRIILRLKVKDVTAGFRCYKRSVLERINLDKIKSNGYAFQEEILFLAQQNNFIITEVPVTFVDRKNGRSKLGTKEIIEFFKLMFQLRFKKI